jgi:capsular polysaccharide biosynthesis protein
VDEWTEGPGLVQSVWRHKWLIAVLLLVGMLGGSLFSFTQPTRYEGVVRIFLNGEQGAGADPERTVISHAQFIQSSTVLDRVIALTGNQLTRKELEKRLTVEASPDADFITIRALDATPEGAVGLADAVSLAYRQILSEQREAAANEAIAALESVQGRLARELAQIQKQRRTGDNPALEAEEQAKKRQMEATANEIEETSANSAGPPPALQDAAAVPDEPVQPKPLRAAAIGAIVGLLFGVALAWWLAARWRVKPREDTAEAQAHVDDDLDEPAKVSHDLVEHARAYVPPPHLTSDVGATASEIPESPEEVRQLVDVDDNRASASVGQTVNSLDKDPDLLYSLAEWLESQHQNFPQITAERLRDRLLFDRVAVLLRTDEGLDLAGCVGWHSDGVRPVGQHDLTILRKLGADGARRIESAERDALLNAGLLGNEDQTIVVAPLKHENVAFGVLLVGHEKQHPEAPLQTNGSYAGIGSFAQSVAPDLHAWLLLHELREQLASHRKAQEQTSSPAGSESASAESQPPPAKSEPASAKSEPPPAKSEPASAKSEPASAELQPASAKSEPASAKSEPPPAKSEPPPAKSEPPAAKSEPAAAESQPAPAESQPAPAESQPAPAESQPAPAESQPAPAESEPPPAWPVYPAQPEPPPAESKPPRARRRRASSVGQQDDHQVGPG